MPKRSGLGQRGLDLLISASSGKASPEPADEKKTVKNKSSGSRKKRV